MSNIMDCPYGHRFSKTRYGTICPHCGFDLDTPEKVYVNLRKECGLSLKEERPVCAWLVCIEGARKGKSYVISFGENFIGTDRDNEIQILGDEKIKKKHTLIYFDEEENKGMLLPARADGIVYIKDKPQYDKYILEDKNILEIGTAIGFSASLMATASPQAKVTTIDRYELMYSRAKANFEKLGLADRITQLEGDAADILPTLEQGKYDFLFMDSAKAKYIEFFPYCMDVLEVGGVLVVDDIFQGGTILEDVMERPRRVRKIHRRLNMFLDLVQSDSTLKSTLLPLGDGIIMIQKMEEKDFKYILEDL